ncbi:AraC family transcriptional regulator [Paenibacillus xylanexedens]|uniref:AraC family transcriptional regulator n=1 Tax=Paenibacillus xylanexedens TaxID=528191 RepID=UPI0011A1BE2C|nr:AraC family transcriptional regulator [Paenibacillus xylanexedens]
MDGQHLPIVPGSGIMVLPGTFIEWAHHSGQIVHVHKLEFEADWDGETAEHPLIMIANRLVAVQPVAKLMELLEQMAELKTTNIGLARFKREILLQEAIYQFAVKACANQPATTKEAVRQTITHMEANYQRNWKVRDLATMACVSMRQYSHIFRQITGTSPMDYLHRVRMDQAKRLLRSTFSLTRCLRCCKPRK